MRPGLDKVIGAFKEAYKTQGKAIEKSKLPPEVKQILSEIHRFGEVYLPFLKVAISSENSGLIEDYLKEGIDTLIEKIFEPSELVRTSLKERFYGIMRGYSKQGK